MGALAEGDWVLDEHGAPCRVTFATEVMEGRPCYRMTFSDGETVIADAEHRWLTWDRCARKNVARNTRVNARRVRSWGPPIRNVTPHVRTTEEIRATLTAGRRGDRNHSIPCTAPLVGQDTSWPVAPYVLGVWLGDGSRNGSQFWGNDPDIAECVAACGETVRKGEQKYQWLLNDGRVGGSPESRAHTLTSRLRRLGVLGNKHIPPQFLRARFADRLALLQGLMDTDGSASKQGGTCEFTSVNPRLAADVLDLCLGLGIRARMTTGRATLNGQDVSAKYRIHFTTSLPVFRLPRKLARLQTRNVESNRNTSHRFIVSVDPVESVPVRCITVDSPSHLFLCTRSYIPTHNTVDGSRWVADGALAGELCGWFAPEYRVLGDAWRELLTWLAPVIRTKHEQDKRLELVTGGVIECWTLDNEDAGRSRKYHRVVVDEAGLVPDLLGRWRLAIRPTLTDYRGRARFYGTPKGRRSGFVALFNRGNDPEDADWQSFRARTMDNPYIPADEIEAARRDMTPEEFAQEYEAIPMDDGANPFGLDRLLSAQHPLSAQPPVVYGLDLARAMDFTVLLGLDAWGHTCRLHRWQAPWAVTKARVLDLAREAGQPVPIVADATGSGDAIVEDLALSGALVTPYHFTQPSKTRLMQRLITAFQNGAIGVPSGADARWLQAELDAFEFAYTATGVKYEAPPGQHDDGVMALALALHGWDRVQGAVPAAPAGLRAMGDDPYVGAGWMGEGLADGAGQASGGGDGRESAWGYPATAPSVPGDYGAQLPAGW